jgi:inosose dehydratase
VEDARRLLALVPELTLLFDSGHLAAAGSDPRDALRDPALRQRIGHVHLKDTWVQQRPDGGTAERFWHFEELGRGNVGTDFAAMLSELEATGYDGWVSVEQDRPTAHPPEEAARLNREYLRRLGY